MREPRTHCDVCGERARVVAVMLIRQLDGTLPEEWSVCRACCAAVALLGVSTGLPDATDRLEQVGAVLASAVLVRQTVPPQVN